jgi:hypothetical protein
VLQLDAAAQHARDARLKEDLDALLCEHALDGRADAFVHAGDDPVGHLDDDDARLAAQPPPFEGVAQEVGHLRRKLDAGGAAAHDDEGGGAARVLRRGVWRDAVERFDHARAQRVGVADFAEGERVLFGALDAPEVRDAADGEDEVVVSELADAPRHRDLFAVEVDVCDGALGEVDFVVADEFGVARRDVPRLDLAAQVFVEERRVQEVIVVGDERHVARPRQLKRREQPPEASAHDQYARPLLVPLFARVHEISPVSLYVESGSHGSRQVRSDTPLCIRGDSGRSHGAPLDEVWSALLLCYAHACRT